MLKNVVMGRGTFGSSARYARAATKLSITEPTCQDQGKKSDETSRLRFEDIGTSKQQNIAFIL